MEEEEEVSKLRRELEGARAALKLQGARCRHIVAAFSRKLQEKELELRQSKGLRDQQLSRLLRALLILESRLRKEQKQIRKQLAERDALIEEQQARLTAREKRDAITWTGDEMEVDVECGTAPVTNLWVKRNGEERLDELCRSNGTYYKDNPVLECVNQILLRDEEELLKPSNKAETSIFLLGKDESLKTEWYEQDTSLTGQSTGSGEAWCISVVEEELPVENESPRVDVKKKSSPPKAQHLEEKVCLEMAKKHLTVARACEVDDTDSKPAQTSPNPSEQSYQEIISKNTTYLPLRILRKPPALPPKPAILLKPHQIASSKHKEEDTKMRSTHSDSSIANLRPQNGVNQRHPPPVMVRKSLSAGALKAQDHNANTVKLHMQELQRNQKNGHVPGNSKVAESLGKADDRLIRVGSSVSSLITGSNGESIVTELIKSGERPAASVSSLVKQFEDNDIRTNFEEFDLEQSYYGDSQQEDGRLDGDGAENSGTHYATIVTALPTTLPPPTKEPEPANRTYETFLESTGLSQKSILTPSRMLSNHRSCLKPKDVKHRSRIKAAVQNSGPTVKYWTEPFL